MTDNGTDKGANAPDSHSPDLNLSKDYVIFLRVILQNIRSVRRNFDEFLSNLESLDLRPEIICLTEVWASENDLHMYELNNYTVIQCCNNSYRAGGVIAYIRNDLNCVRIPVCFTSADCVCFKVSVEFGGDVRNFVFLCVYRLHGRAVPLFLNELRACLDGLLFDNLYVLGDMNIDILNLRLCGDYDTLMAGYGLSPLFREPTRVGRTSSTCLDHMYSRNSLGDAISNSAEVIRTGVTDHFTVSLNIAKRVDPRCRGQRDRGADAECVVRSSIDFDQLNLCLRAEGWADVWECESVDAAFEVFIERLKGYVGSCTRTVELRGRRHCPIKPWITHDLCNRIHAKNKLMQLARRHPGNERLAAYSRKIAGNMREAVRRAKEAFYASKLHAARGDIKKSWRIVNEIAGRGKRTTAITELFADDGTLIKEKSDICNELNKYFTSIIGDLTSGLRDDLDPPWPDKTVIGSLFLRPVTSLEVLTIIGGLKNQCAPGLDGITNRILKSTSLNIVDVLTHLINLSLERGIFPAALKTAVVVPILKKGDKRQPGNYRPISLVSSISKIIERVVHARLTSFLASNNFLSGAQYGFRSRMGCEDAVGRLVGDINTALNCEPKRAVAALFLDLTKAFDAVRHDVLLAKLERAGCRGLALDWFGTYLTGRRQMVRLSGDCVSDPLDCASGVPQGSVLGPLLFLIYLNSLLDGGLSGAAIAYADDVTLLYVDDAIEDVETRLRDDLGHVRRWLDAHGMLMSGKTVLMQFGSRRPNLSDAVCHSPVCPGPGGRCLPECIGIDRVDHYKYLGVVLDSSLGWSAHIERVRESLRVVCRQIYALRSSCSPDLLRAFYFALGESRLRYGLIFWGGACDSHVQSLVVAQKYIIRAMSFAGRREHSAPLFLKWRLMTVRGLYILRVAEAYLGRHIRLAAFFRENPRTSRRAEILETPRPTTEAFKRTLNFLAPLIINNLNNELSDISGESVAVYLLSLDQDATGRLMVSRYQ